MEMKPSRAQFSTQSTARKLAIQLLLLMLVCLLNPAQQWQTIDAAQLDTAAELDTMGFRGSPQEIPAPAPAPAKQEQAGKASSEVTLDANFTNSIIALAVGFALLQLTVAFLMCPSQITVGSPDRACHNSTTKHR